MSKAPETFPVLENLWGVLGVVVKGRKSLNTTGALGTLEVFGEMVANVADVVDVVDGGAGGAALNTPEEILKGGLKVVANCIVVGLCCCCCCLKVVADCIVVGLCCCCCLECVASPCTSFLFSPLMKQCL